MNLLVDAHIFDDKHQGTRTYLKGLYSHLIIMAPNWHFFLVANSIEHLENEFGTYQNVTYLPLKHKNKFYRLLIELPQIIKKNKIQFAHYQYISPPLKNCKQIVTLHDILFEQKEFKTFFPLKYRLINGFLFRISAKRADVLFTVSEYSKNKIAELYAIDKEQIHITPNAVSDAYFDETLDNSKNKMGKYILYVSRVEPRKNHLNLLKAFIELELQTQGYKLVFIGKKDITSKDLKQYLEQLDASEKESLIWLENVSNENLRLYYKHCELFIFPSFAEGFGIPPLEAMAFNKKLLCSNATAMSDFKLPEEATFNPYDVTELKRKIEYQLSNNFKLHQVYETILNRYSWKTVAQNFKETLSNHI